MSKPGDFDRIDRPDDGGKGKPDRFAQFQTTTSALLRYREEYHVAAQAGVPLGDLPHPDQVGPAEVEGALAALGGLRDRSLGGRLRAVPTAEIRGGPGSV